MSHALATVVTLVAVALAGACARPGGVSAATRYAASRPSPAPLYVAVHVDHLQPDGMRAFVAARKTWLLALSRHATTDGRGLYVQTGDSGFLSLRALSSMGDLDRLAKAAAAALAPMDPADQKAYDAASDALLVPPHRSEIWRYDPDLSFGAVDPMAALASAGWGKMTVEEIDPTPAGDDYEAAWREIAAALRAVDYPLVRVSYDSRYGTGDLVSFWLAKSQAEFLQITPVEATVTSVLGPEKAAALFERQRRVVRASDGVDVLPRLDLSSKPL